MKSLTKRIGKRANRRNRQTNRVQMGFESLESRTMMAGLSAGADIVADSPDNAGEGLREPVGEAALVGQPTLHAAHDNPIGIERTPHPRVADMALRVGVESTTSRVEQGVDLESLATTGLQQHAANANDYVMGMGWSAHTSDDLVGIDPLPTPHPRPEAAVEHVGLVPIPSGRPRPEAELELAGWIPEPTIQPRPEAAIERAGLVPIPSGRPTPEAEAGRVKIEPNPRPSPCGEANDSDDNPVGIDPLPTPHPRPEAKVGQVGIEPNPLPQPIETGFAARVMNRAGRAF